ncbi:hypothetical protein HOY80DRAFT_262725 [Tuber brumale]|nr:hypothetical protein HOY80DRAFT_262725 [Tuber brumale]
MESCPYPSSLEEVVTLVRRLYQPGSPQVLSQIQETLQAVQRSQDGWKLADSLLAIDDQYVQFFGALTFTVKLNSDSASLSPKDIPILRDRLIDWLVRFNSLGLAQLVVRKLCSTLVVFFIRFPHYWDDCLRHIICSLCFGRFVSTAELPQLPPSGKLLKVAEPRMKITALWFSAILVEEVGKVDSRNLPFSQQDTVEH